MACSVFGWARTLPKNGVSVKYVVAVSGGVDSVVLLHKMVARGDDIACVAHFDHGIRDDSADDARFVEAVAARYGVPFETMREELGPNASEEVARKYRYGFLHELAYEHGAKIATAHHADDVVETVAINLTRGTGWRGLAVLDSSGAYRPLLHETKADIYEYATQHKLEWVEDATNATDDYLRNRLRKRAARMLPDGSTQAILALRDAQVTAKRAIATEVAKFISPDHEYDRYFFICVGDSVAIELVRAAVAVQIGAMPTRPQAERALLAIKTARNGSTFELGGGVYLAFQTRKFIVHTPLQMVQ